MEYTSKCKCKKLPTKGNFTVGDEYVYERHQMNDIVFYDVTDDNNEHISFYEWFSFSSHFENV